MVGYLLGNLLELVLGDLGAIEKPLLIGIVILTIGWIVYRHGKDHFAQTGTGAKPGRSG